MATGERPGQLEPGVGRRPGPVGAVRATRSDPRLGEHGARAGGRGMVRTDWGPDRGTATAPRRGPPSSPPRAQRWVRSSSTRSGCLVAGRHGRPPRRGPGRASPRRRGRVLTAAPPRGTGAVRRMTRGCPPTLPDHRCGVAAPCGGRRTAGVVGTSGRRCGRSIECVADQRVAPTLEPALGAGSGRQQLSRHRPRPGPPDRHPGQPRGRRPRRAPHRAPHRARGAGPHLVAAVGPQIGAPGVIEARTAAVVALDAAAWPRRSPRLPAWTADRALITQVVAAGSRYEGPDPHRDLGVGPVGHRRIGRPGRRHRPLGIRRRRPTRKAGGRGDGGADAAVWAAVVRLGVAARRGGGPARADGLSPARGRWRSGRPRASPRRHLDARVVVPESAGDQARRDDPLAAQDVVGELPEDKA